LVRSRLWLGAASVVLACAALTGCGATDAVTTPSHASIPAAELALVDPLAQLTNPASTDYVEGDLRPVLNEKGSGPATFEIALPDAVVTGVRYYVSCAPASTFTITASAFFASPCSSHVLSSASIPLSPSDAPLTVTLDVPDGVNYWLVALPVQ
jgi:hypothetical protein